MGNKLIGWALLTLVMLLATVNEINGQKESGRARSVSPVLSFRFGEVDKSYQFSSDIVNSDFTLRVRDETRLGLGFLYQVERDGGDFFRLGISNLVFTQSNSLHTEIRESSGIVENISGDSGSTFAVVGHLEYGQYLFRSNTKKLRLGIGGYATPFIDLFRYNADDSRSSNYRLSQYGLSLGISPRLSLRLSERIDLDLSFLATLINTQYNVVYLQDPQITANERRINELETNVAIENTHLLIGVRFNI